MARIVNFEGRSISVPDDATDDEVASIIGSVVPANQVLQPAQQAAKQPVGTSNENDPYTLKELGRQGALTLRYGLEGIGSIPQIIGAPLESIGLKGAGSNVGTIVSDLFGLPVPRNSMERVVGSAARAMASASPSMMLGQAMQASKALSETARNVGSVIASQPAMQLAMSGTSGTASEMAKEGGIGEVGQTVAGIAAPIAAAPLLMTAQGAGRIAKNVIAPMVSEKAAERGAAKLVTSVAGKRAPQVAEALSVADADKTAGQVAAAIDNADVAAIQKIANEKNASFADLVKRGTAARMDKSWEALEESLAPVRNEAFVLAKRGEVDVSNILNKIDHFRKSSGNLSDDVLQNATGDVRSKILRLAEDGPIDPAELHTIRKQLSSTIGKFSKESADWDKKKAAKVERALQLAIDDAMDKAITKANPELVNYWSGSYIQPYAKGAGAIRNITDMLERETDLAAKAMGSTRAKMTGTENPIAGVNMLSRIATITNTLIRAAEGAAGSKTEAALARMMAPDFAGGDKKKLARLMTEELNRPKTFRESIIYKRGPTRAELGYETMPVQRGMLTDMGDPK